MPSNPTEAKNRIGALARQLVWRLPSPIKEPIQALNQARRPARSEPIAPTDVAEPDDLGNVTDRFDIEYPADIADKEAVRAFLADTDIFGEATQEGANYLLHALERFRITLAITPDVSPEAPVLELGSNPYFFTRLLIRRGLDVRCANWFGPGHEPKGSQTVKAPRSGSVHTLEFDHFNIEVDRFPYPDDSFSLVFFCEILEHLPLDPVNALAEIHRVLIDGGWLVLSTPNPVRNENLVNMLAGDNVYEPISGYGVNGRHNREYTVAELRTLLSELGFGVERIFTADVSPVPIPFPSTIEGVEIRDRGEYVFVVARAVGPDRWRYPDWLYQSKHALGRVVLPGLEVGRNDDLQSSGLHYLETIEGHEVRWMGLSEECRVLALSARAGISTISISGLAPPAEAGSAIVLSARIGDESVSWEIECGTDAFEVNASIEVPAGELEIVLATDRTWRPVDVGLGQDERNLGVAIGSVALSAM